MPRSYTHGIYGDTKSFAGLGEGNTIASLTRLNVVDIFVDFIHGQDVLDGANGDWLLTDVGAGVSAGDSWSILENSQNGIAALVAGDDASEGLEAAMWGGTSVGASEFIVPSDKKWITYIAKIGKADADQAATFAGLASKSSGGATDTVLHTDGTFIAINYAGFWTAADSNALFFRSARSSGSEASSYDMGITLTDGELVVVGFRIEVDDISDDDNNGAIRLFQMESNAGIAGVVPTSVSDQDPGPLGKFIEYQDAQATTLNAVPNDSLAPAFSCVNPAGTTGNALYCDFFYCSTLRA